MNREELAAAIFSVKDKLQRRGELCDDITHFNTVYERVMKLHKKGQYDDQMRRALADLNNDILVSKLTELITIAEELNRLEHELSPFGLTITTTKPKP